MKFNITRTEVIGEVDTSIRGKIPAQAAVLHMIADHVQRTEDTTGTYTAELGGLTVGVDLFTPQEDGDNGSPA
jgi:hypothetical protein